jgi:hypothetical protein
MASLAPALIAQMLAALDGLTPATSKPIFSAFDFGVPSCTRNAANWLTLAGVDHTCVSFWDDWDTQFASGTKVSNNIVVVAHHDSGDATGRTIRFADADGNITGRLINDYRNVNDVGLCKLGLAAANIGNAQVLPTNYRDYLPGLAYSFTASLPDGVPVATFDKDGQALVAEWYGEWLSGSPTPTPYCFSKEPSNATLASFYETAVSGDSSGAVALVLAGQLVVIGPTKGSTWGAESIVQNRAAIDAAIAEMSGLPLTDVDLSAYSTVPEVYEAPAFFYRHEAAGARIKQALSATPRVRNTRADFAEFQ